MSLKKTITEIFNSQQIPSKSVDLTVSLNELDNIAQEFKNNLQPGDWLFLDGDLGSGKTTFVKKLVQSYKNSNDNISSPTFSILNCINIDHKYTTSNLKKIIHLDLYRIKKGIELLYLGLEQEFSPKNSICIFEWPYNIEKEDFLSFFATTKCPHPLRIIEIQFELDSQSNHRLYSIKKIQL